MRETVVIGSGASPPSTPRRSYQSRSPRTTWASNGNREDALRTTISLFELCKRVLKKNAPLILCQSGGKPDNLEIRNAAEENGWQCCAVATWVKTHRGTEGIVSPAPSCMGNPYGSCSEKMMIFVREEERLERLSNFDNGDILIYPTDTRSAHAKFRSGEECIGEHHTFEHPVDLGVDLIKRHVPENSGGIVFEPFGCSGFASVAAIQLGLNWVYCESNRNNYEFGCERIIDAQLKKDQGSSDSKDLVESELAA